MAIGTIFPSQSLTHRPHHSSIKLQIKSWLIWTDIFQSQTTSHWNHLKIQLHSMNICWATIHFLASNLQISRKRDWITFCDSGDLMAIKAGKQINWLRSISFRGFHRMKTLLCDTISVVFCRPRMQLTERLWMFREWIWISNPFCWMWVDFSFLFWINFNANSIFYFRDSLNQRLCTTRHLKSAIFCCHFSW